MSKNITKHELGTFKITSSKIRVSDPCYDDDVWCKGTVENARKGTWKAFSITSEEGNWGNRVAGLIAYHEDSSEPEGLEDSEWEHQEFEVGVDSGQAGIFDEKFYRDDDATNSYEYIGSPLCDFEKDGDNWYNVCCDITLYSGKTQAGGAGVLPYGVVSSSGFGDGGYNCYVKKDDDGKVVAICIDYGLIGYCEECGSRVGIDNLEYGRCEYCIEAEEDEEREAEEEAERLAEEDDE